MLPVARPDQSFDVDAGLGRLSSGNLGRAKKDTGAI
jgi:hypothetical protein